MLFYSFTVADVTKFFSFAGQEEGSIKTLYCRVLTTSWTKLLNTHNYETLSGFSCDMQIPPVAWKASVALAVNLFIVLIFISNLLWLFPMIIITEKDEFLNPALRKHGDRLPQKAKWKVN